MVQLESGVINILVQAFLVVFGAIVTYLTAVLVSYFSKKRELVIKEIGDKKYDYICKIGKIIFYSLEQEFKNKPKSGDEKRQAFDKLISGKFPDLTQEQINRYREAIVNEEHLKIDSLRK